MARIATRGARVVALAALATLALVPAAPGESTTVEITGFVALFQQSEYTTTYRVAARGKNLSFKWTKVQAGKTCGLFTTERGEAKWRHPHKSQMDPEVPADKWCEAHTAGGRSQGDDHRRRQRRHLDVCSDVAVRVPVDRGGQGGRRAGAETGLQGEELYGDHHHAARAGPSGSRRRPEELAGQGLAEGFRQPDR